MDTNKIPPKTTDGNAAYTQVQNKTNQPSMRTSVASGSGATISDNKPSLASPGTIIVIGSNQSEQELNNDVTKAPSLRNRNDFSVTANKTAVVEVVEVHLRGIMDGGMNLGDSHLTHHSSLPKRKQKRPKVPAKRGIAFTQPQTSPPGDQYSVPKTTPRTLQEIPDLENYLNMRTSVASCSGGRYISPAPQLGSERSPSVTRTVVEESSYFETPNYNAHEYNKNSNLVEKLPGRVSYLSKLNTSSKGAFEGGSSALNVSKRPKHTQVPSRASINDSTPMVSRPVKIQIDLNELSSELEGESKLPHTKYKGNAKEMKGTDFMNYSLMNQTEPKLQLIEQITNQKRSERIPENPIALIPGYNALPQLLTPMKPNQCEQTSGLQAQATESSEEISAKLPADFNPKILTSENSGQKGIYHSHNNLIGNVTEDKIDDIATNNDIPKGVVDVSGQKPLTNANHLNHEELAVPKRSVQKGTNKSKRDGGSKKGTSIQKDVTSPKVADELSRQMRPALEVSSVIPCKPQQSNRTPNPGEVTGTTRRIIDEPKNSSGGSAVPRTSQKEMSRKLMKDEMAKNVMTPPLPGLGNHDAVPKDGPGSHKAKRNTLLKSDGEKNLGLTESAVSHAHLLKPMSNDKQEATSANNPVSLEVAVSSSIIDLPLPGNMNS